MAMPWNAEEQEVAPRHGPGTEKHTYKVPKAPSRRTRTHAREPLVQDILLLGAHPEPCQGGWNGSLIVLW